MKLTDVFHNGQLKNTNTQAAGQSVASNGQSASVSRQIQALTPGQTLQGEVVSREGNQVQIRVADDFVLEAKVDQNINLEVGKTMTFEVRNNGQTLQLSPLFANTATEANALKALEMASLPVTQDTVAMTGLMMEAGLSIDKNSLQQMFREVNTYPGSNISDVVDLHRLGMSVNEENLNQVSSYKNLTHQLVDGMHNIQQGLSDTMGNMVADGNVEGAAKMFNELLQLVQGGMDGEVTLSEQAQAASGSLSVVEDGTESALGSVSKVIADASVIIDENNLQTTAGNATEAADNAKMSGNAQAAQLQEALSSAVKQLQGGADEELLNMLKELGAMAEGENGASGNVSMFLQESLVSVLKSQQGSGYTELINQLSQALQSGSVTEQAKALEQLLTQGLKDGNKALLETLIGHKDAKNILSDGLARLWTITPEDVADSGKVEELYTRLDKQLKSLSHILEQSGQEQSAAFKAVNNMSQNVDFLQQLNQAYTYVQLPLRLQNGEAHGDLYVYTNKRNLSAKDGQISALLHLDMEHLGPVDVYVAMQAEHVNTRFYVQDDEMLDFLEQHMDILTQRLQKRGYNCDFAMQIRGADDQTSGLQGLLAKEQAQPIAQYAFDVRA